MRRVSIALFVLLLALLVALPTNAQVIHRAANRPAAARPVVAAVAAAPAPVVVIAPNQSLYFPSGTPVYFNLPLIVAPDGRVFADFGRGWEQVIRNCSAVMTSSYTTVVQPAVSQPTVVQPQPAVTTQQPVVYTPPTVPGQTITSQVMLSPAAQQTIAAQQVLAVQPYTSGQACWGTAWNGQLFVARP